MIALLYIILIVLFLAWAFDSGQKAQQEQNHRVRAKSPPSHTPPNARIARAPCGNARKKSVPSVSNPNRSCLVKDRSVPPSARSRVNSPGDGGVKGTSIKRLTCIACRMSFGAWWCSDCHCMIHGFCRKCHADIWHDPSLAHSADLPSDGVQHTAHDRQVAARNRRLMLAARTERPSKSYCIECDQEMDYAEAVQYYACRDCRKKLKASFRVRNLSRPGTEEVGRSSRSASVIGGVPEEFEWARDDI